METILNCVNPKSKSVVDLCFSLKSVDAMFMRYSWDTVYLFMRYFADRANAKSFWQNFIGSVFWIYLQYCTFQEFLFSFVFLLFCFPFFCHIFFLHHLKFDASRLSWSMPQFLQLKKQKGRFLEKLLEIFTTLASSCDQKLISPLLCSKIFSVLEINVKWNDFLQVLKKTQKFLVKAVSNNK